MAVVRLRLNKDDQHASQPDRTRFTNNAALRL
jgi:hypothetical protein